MADSKPIPRRRCIKPYDHDCKRCIWVGWIYVKGGGKFGADWGNMYFCPNDPDYRDTAKYPGSVLIRFSDEPSDYWSSGVGECVKGALDCRSPECCKCGADVPGVTVHDFKFDENRTPIDWKFCPNCFAEIGERLVKHNLTPGEVHWFNEKAGDITFHIHEDFYDECGNAMQPSG